MTLEQIGVRYGVTRERIRQIEARALPKMRKYAKQLAQGKFINKKSIKKTKIEELEETNDIVNNNLIEVQQKTEETKINNDIIEANITVEAEIEGEMVEETEQKTAGKSEPEKNIFGFNLRKIKHLFTRFEK